MGLSLEQIKILVKEKPRQREIAKGIWHSNRLKFHTETVLQKSELSDYYNEYIDWIGSNQPELLPKEKIARFLQLLTCPLPTVELTESITTALSRVFDAQDAFFRYDFEDEELETDWEDYRDDEFWRTRGVEAMMNAIDSVWVVDFGDEDDKPAPQNLLIDIGDVIDIRSDSKGVCYHVIFTVGDKLYVYDEDMIQVFEYEKEEIGQLVSEFAHGLGYCPARMFWSEYLESKNWINHKAPLTNVLGELDWMLTHAVFKKYMDIANSFPILVTYQQDGGIEDSTREENKGRHPLDNETRGGSYVAPGTILEVPIPMEGQPDLMANAVKWIAPDIATLEFHVGETVRLKTDIYSSVVGVEGEPNNDMAKNEKQVMSAFESQSNILRRIAKNLRLIMEFADKTIIALRYGVEIEPSIDFGSKFFLKTIGDISEEMEESKSSEIVFDALHEELIDNKFRNDPAGKTRAGVIADLDPLPGRTIKEAEELYKAGGISEEEFKLKGRLMAFVRRFEREQLPMDKFVANGDYNAKINLIKKTFKGYESEFETDSGDQGEGSDAVPHRTDEDKIGSQRPEEAGEDNMGEGMENS